MPFRSHRVYDILFYQLKWTKANPVLLSIATAQFYIPISSMQGSQFLHILTDICCLFFFFNNSCLESWYEVILTVVLICIWLVTLNLQWNTICSEKGGKLQSVITWINLEDIKPSDISQSPKTSSAWFYLLRYQK